MLTDNHIKSELSLAYIHAVVSRASFGVEHTRVDFDSVDVSVKASGKLSSDSVYTSPSIDIQLKATVNADTSAQSIAFALPQKNYNDLIENSCTPKILVLLCLPEDADQWLSHSNGDLILRNCAYWLSLRGLSPTQNTTSTTVHLPTANMFSPTAIRELLIKVSKQEAL